VILVAKGVPLSSINGDNVDLWHGELAVVESAYQHYWPLLDATERTHAGKLANPLLRQRYVEVHGRLRGVLSRYLGQPPEQINIKKAPHGKPYLADYPGLAFNLSHTANNLMIAVAQNCQLGVDIEHCKPRSNLALLVGKCFADVEAAYWHQLPESEKTVAFYCFWTKKEAFVKATGRGIALGLKACVIDPANPGMFLNLPDDYGQTSAWRIADINLPCGQPLCGALVRNKAIANINLFDFRD